MNRFTKAAVVAIALMTTAAPLAAQAQSRDRDHREQRRDDRRDYRSERRDDRRDYRQDHRNDRRDYRDDRRDDRRDYRNDRRNDRRDWRQDRRASYRDWNGPRQGQWYAPGRGYYNVEPRYYGHRWARGGYLPPAYRGYYVDDYYRYGLNRPPHGYRYVYANDDILLVALTSGLIAGVFSNLF
ncbi:hypothetical protein ASG17_08290 [Brevundimonas sp. Leaf363]|uniref:RcnB family protein n=1 Tax=Brevundimonas sp. Leaf363 TaxID=1736353 RepID=UPI0006FE0B4A|nr:RcnB family protein [Brevundimonas sp. Leaf363]KQS56029.1 hypothetical protein ASG17_08290 [Brevundimonas sp. Leaf363]